MTDSQAALTIDRSCSFQIRKAKLEDIPHILHLLSLKAEFDGCPEALTATAEQLEQDLFETAPLAAVLLAEVGREIVGFAAYYPIYSTFLARPGLWLDDLFIQSEFRGQKIGQALMARLCKIAQELGCARIDWTVATNNYLGIHFYEKIGAIVQQEVRTCRLNRAAIAQNALPLQD
jgi:ribosomal protein S18 acetylase RimI-like enzyme